VNRRAETTSSQTGDSLYTIAKEEGFLNWRSIYDAPENESLRVLRPNPQVLLPGDVVVIPDVELPGTPCRSTNGASWPGENAACSLFASCCAVRMALPSPARNTS